MLEKLLEFDLDLTSLKLSSLSSLIWRTGFLRPLNELVEMLSTSSRIFLGVDPLANSASGVSGMMSWSLSGAGYNV